MMNYNKTDVKPAMTGYFAGLIIIGAIYVYGFGLERFRPEIIRDMMQSMGCWGPVFYIICNVLRPFFMFPAITLGIAGGLAFGPLWGTVYLVIGTAFGAALCFGVARLLGLDRLKRFWPNWLPTAELDNQTARHGFKTVLALRLVPGLPWDVVSFMAGTSKVRFAPYFLATFIGSIPGALVLSYLGESLFRFCFNKVFLLSGGIIIVVIWIYLNKRYQP